MAQRVNFKLTYNGHTHRFTSTLADNELFRAVIVKVASTVKEEDFDLFWKDDDALVVLETLKDFTDAIEFAKATIKGKSPCVHLIVGTPSSETESECRLSPSSPVAETALITIAPTPSRLARTVEPLLHLMSAFEQHNVIDSPFLAEEMTSYFHLNYLRPQQGKLISAINRQMRRAVLAFLRKDEYSLHNLQKWTIVELASVLMLSWMERDAKDMKPATKRVTPAKPAALMMIALTGGKTVARLQSLLEIVSLNESNGQEEAKITDEQEERALAQLQSANEWIRRQAREILHHGMERIKLARIVLPEPVDTSNETAAQQDSNNERTQTATHDDEEDDEEDEDGDYEMEVVKEESVGFWSSLVRGMAAIIPHGKAPAVPGPLQPRRSSEPTASAAKQLEQSNQVADFLNTFFERERQVKQREKAMELKEEAFERRMSEVERKMEEMLGTITKDPKHDKGVKEEKENEQKLKNVGNIDEIMDEKNTIVQ